VTVCGVCAAAKLYVCLSYTLSLTHSLPTGWLADPQAMHPSPPLTHSLTHSSAAETMDDDVPRRSNPSGKYSVLRFVLVRLTCYAIVVV